MENLEKNNMDIYFCFPHFKNIFGYFILKNHKSWKSWQAWTWLQSQVLFSQHHTTSAKKHTEKI